MYATYNIGLCYALTMATLYVENVPDELYEALREQARNQRKSIAAEVIELLGQCAPTAAELNRRKEFLNKIRELQAPEPLSPGPFPSTEELVRADRRRLP